MLYIGRADSSISSINILEYKNGHQNLHSHENHGKVLGLFVHQDKRKFFCDISNLFFEEDFEVQINSIILIIFR